MTVWSTRQCARGMIWYGCVREWHYCEQVSVLVRSWTKSGSLPCMLVIPYKATREVAMDGVNFESES